MFRRSLHALPTELLHNIAQALVATNPLGPPRELIPLILTCRAWHAIFTADTLLAAICRLKFDTAAVTRRAFTPHTHDLAEQLVHACTLLRAIRAGDVYDIDAHEHLFTAYMLMLDNDGKNYAQLEWAGMGAYVARFVRRRLWEECAANEGWPVDNAANACALWLMWMTTTREKLHAETPQEREELVLQILPFVVLPQRPRPTQYPHYLDPARSQSQVHFRARPQLAPPLASVAAKLLFVARREVFPIRVPPTMPPGLTVEDYAELNRGKAAQLPRGARWDWDVGRARAVNGDGEEVVDEEDGESRRWDTEWWRRRLCYDCMAPRPRFTPGLVFTPGCMRGQWQGRIYIPQGNLFHQVLHSPLYPGLADEAGLFSERSLGLVMQPVFLNIREHHRVCGCPMGGCGVRCGGAGASGTSTTTRTTTSSASSSTDEVMAEEPLMPTSRTGSRASTPSHSHPTFTASSLPEAAGCGIVPVPAPARVRFVRPNAAEAANANAPVQPHPIQIAPLLQDEEHVLDDEPDNHDALGQGNDPNSLLHTNVHTIDASLRARLYPDRIDMSMANAWMPGALGGVSALVREASAVPSASSGGRSKEEGSGRTRRRRDEVVFGVDYERGDYRAVGGCVSLGGSAFGGTLGAASSSSTPTPPPSSSTSSTSASFPSSATSSRTPLPSSSSSAKSYIYETYDPARPSSHDPSTCLRCAEWAEARAEERRRVEREAAEGILERLMKGHGQGEGHGGTEELDVSGLDLDLDVQEEDDSMDVEEPGGGDNEGDEDESEERLDVLGDDLPQGQPPILDKHGTVLVEPTRREFDRERVGVEGGCGGGVRDVLLTGETDPRHAVWHQQQYTIYGRVRPWDGLIGILRVGSVPSVNYLFICGYLVGERNFVGEWRVAHADPLRPTWGSAVVMSRREGEA
ncbi:unnamed protein product [Cyclocybe aegerita]|uniref:F-box domain-containing protein n=1 Tax=Cyclocybe aegerita TaxID=1973307 RepID=A0A8S0W090_CYCAE|nr:unnamed protein product [Cyclocybe aegerita]